jgi:hypothetical protein
MGTGFLPGVKQPGRGADHPGRGADQPLLAPWSRMSRAIPLFPLWALVACYRVTFTFTFTHKFCGPGSSVGIVTGYGLDGPGIESRVV